MADSTDQVISDEKKKSFLRFYLGAEGLRQFLVHPIHSQTAPVSYNDYLTAAKSIFDRPVNAVRGHYEFNNRKQ